MNRAVADATVLISLAKIGGLDRLDELFTSVLVPPSVHEEALQRGRDEGYADAMAVDEATDAFLDVRDLSPDATERAAQIRETANLGAGESDAIALADETEARCLTDDHAARGDRRVARWRDTGPPRGTRPRSARPGRRRRPACGPRRRWIPEGRPALPLAVEAGEDRVE